jgi:hypothetical protein
MKTKSIILLALVGIIFTSCLSENYRFVTRFNRDGSFRRDVYTTADSITHSFPYQLSSWEVTSTDTVIDGLHRSKKPKNINVGRMFSSMEALTDNRRNNVYFPTPEEKFKKRFRWFYTYYSYTAIYPEVSEKGRVPIHQYLNSQEQMLYLRGDLSAYRGMNGMDLNDALDEIETKFMDWYSRNMYEECFSIILQYTNGDEIVLSVKDTLYSIYKKQLSEPNIEVVCKKLDAYHATDRFTKLYAENKTEMDKILDSRMKMINELLNFDIQYEVLLPGKVITSNANLDSNNSNVLAWRVNMFRFLSADDVLTAESRTVNVWTFVVTALLIFISIYCFIHQK